MNTNENSMLMEVWQPEISSQPQQTNLEELKSWINDGKLFPTSKVRIKNLNWIEAQQVPAFKKLFDLKTNVATGKSTSIQNPTFPLNNNNQVKTKSENTEPTIPSQNSAVSANINKFKIYSDISEKDVPIQIGEDPVSIQTTEKKEVTKAKQVEKKPEQLYPQPKPKKNKNTSFSFIKNILVFLLGCSLMFLLSWGGSYLWVYQLRSPIKIDEESVTELVILQNKLETDRIGLRLKIAASEQEAAAAAANNQEVPLPKADFSQELAKLEKQYEAQRKIVLENYRTDLVMNDFNNNLYVSFVILMILFLLIRIFYGKKSQPTENIHSTKSFSPRSDNSLNSQTVVNQDVKIENSQSIHVTKTTDTHITTSPDSHTTKSPDRIETLDEFLQNSEYLNYVESDKFKHCLMHQSELSTFICEVCKNHFCSECPQTVESIENCCPFCKVVCKSVDSIKSVEIEQEEITKDYSQGKLSKKERKTLSNFTVYDYQDEKKKKLGIISAFLISLCFSSSMSYFWVYEISPGLEKKDISQNIDAGPQSPDKSKVANSVETKDGKTVEVANVNQGVNSPNEPCIDPQTNQSFVCDEETKKALYEHTRKTKSVSDTQKQVSEKTNSILGLILPSSGSSTENASNGNLNPVDIERKENDKRRFFQIFITSFMLLFGGLILVVFVNKKRNNLPE